MNVNGAQGTYRYSYSYQHGPTDASQQRLTARCPASMCMGFLSKATLAQRARRSNERNVQTQKIIMDAGKVAAAADAKGVVSDGGGWTSGL